MTGHGNPTPADFKWMQRALDIARQGLGHVEPNPMVGAVVASGETLIAEAYHRQFGGPHAEVLALKAAAECSRGATLYVTLEPCCHHGKTPPCSDLVIRSGIARVVIAMCDPFHKVCGQGIDQLRAAGLEVIIGVLEAEARLLNQPFIKRVTTHRPYVTAKWAMTLDGRLASSTGDSKWISGPQSRKLVHSLRSRMDAIIVGAVTAQADDPQLTVRLEHDPDSTPAADYGRRPLRIVIDPDLTLSPQSHLVRTARQVPVMVVTTATAADHSDDAAGDADDACHADDADDADAAARAIRARALTDAGVEICYVAASETSSAPPAEQAEKTTARADNLEPPAANAPAPSAAITSQISVDALLAELASRDMTNVLIEGGVQTLQTFFAAQAIDALAVFIAPKLIGGPPRHLAPGPSGLTLMQNAMNLSNATYTPTPPDILITGTLRQY